MGLNHGYGAQMKHLFRSVPARDFTSVELLEELLLIGGDDLDQMVVERFFFGESFRVAHGLFGKLAVAPAPGGETAQQRGGIVLDLLAHDVIHLASQKYGRRSAGVGAGRHGSHIAGFEQEESGGGGARSAGSDVRDDGNRRSGKLLDDFARRVEQSAGRVQ